MILWILILALVVGIVVAGVNESLDRYVAYALTAVFVLLAAGLAGGRDHLEYVAMIDLSREIPLNRPDLLLIGRIDPLFTLLVHGVGQFTDAAYPIFLGLAILGFATKLWLSALLPGYRALFIAGYALLLAPYFEFAAIRAAVAVGFIGIAFGLHPFSSRLGASLVAMMAHISAIIPSAVSLGTRERASWIKAASLMVLVAGAATASTAILALLPRAATLLNNSGTLVSLVPPAIAGVLSLLVFPRNAPDVARAGPHAPRMALAASIIFAFGLGTTLAFVTVAYRMLQIGFFLAFLSICIILRNRPSVLYRHRLVGTLAALIVLLCWLNFRQLMWAPLIAS